MGTLVVSNVSSNDKPENFQPFFLFLKK